MIQVLYQNIQRILVQNKIHQFHSSETTKFQILKFHAQKLLQKTLKMCKSKPKHRKKKIMKNLNGYNKKFKLSKIIKYLKILKISKQMI